MRQPPDLFLHCPIVDTARLRSSMPAPYLELVETLLKHIPRNVLTDDLVYMSRDFNGDIQYGAAVQMRPWEWMEFLGDPTLADAKESERDADGKGSFGVKHEVRNNTSIPLEMFGTRPTAEGVRQIASMDENPLSGPSEHLRSVFEDDLASESVYERHWRESRTTELEVAETTGTEIIGGSASSGQGTPRSNLRASPALSVRTNLCSRSSAGPPLSAASSAHRTQSPALSNRGDPMDIDIPSSATISRAKRKAAVAGLPLEEPTHAVATDEASKKGKQRSVSGKSTAGKSSGKTMRKKK